MYGPSNLFFVLSDVDTGHKIYLGKFMNCYALHDSTTGFLTISGRATAAASGLHPFSANPASPSVFEGDRSVGAADPTSLRGSRAGAHFSLRVAYGFPESRSFFTLLADSTQAPLSVLTENL